MFFLLQKKEKEEEKRSRSAQDRVPYYGPGPSTSRGYRGNNGGGYSRGRGGYHGGQGGYQGGQGGYQGGPGGYQGQRGGYEGQGGAYKRPTSQIPASEQGSKIICRKCGGVGHKGVECPSARK